MFCVLCRKGKVCKIKYDFDASNILNRSKLLRQIKEERRLQEWF